jgi:PAS domain S-box-containing protein
MSSSQEALRLPRAPSLSWSDCRLLVESVSDYAIFMLDAGGCVASWNLGAERIKGYQAHEIIGEHFSRFYRPEDVSSGKPGHILSAASSEGRVEDEGWRVRKDGSQFWANVVVTALRDPAGNLRGFGKVTRDLTVKRVAELELRRAEESLRRSEERFRLLVENTVDYAIYVLDKEGRVATWNLGAERMKGYCSSEIVGQYFGVFFPQEDRQAGKPAAELAMASSQGRFEDEGWRVRKDGTRFWANAILTALHDTQGELIGFAKITRDLSARREAEATERRLIREQTAREVAEQAQRQLREGEERYRALSQRLEIVLEGVADGIVVEDRQRRTVFANTAAAWALGLASASELMEESAVEANGRYQIFDQERQPMLTDRLPGRRVLAGESSSSAVLVIRESKTSAERWYAVRARAVMGADGKPELAVSIWHDVTAERRQEFQTKCLSTATEALGRHIEISTMLSSLAHALVPSIADFCSIHLLEGDLVRTIAVAHEDVAQGGRAAEYLRTHSPLSLGQAGIWNVLRTGKSELHEDIGLDVLSNWASIDEHVQQPNPIQMRSGILVPILIRERAVGVLLLAKAEPAHRYGVSDTALLEEVARRTGVALENAKLYADAQAAARAAENASRAKDEFLATVSHELRTPLTAIVGWSSLLKQRVTDPALYKPVDVILRNANAQVKIIDDILDVSRVITGKFRIEPKAVSLVEIVRDSLEIVRPSAAAKRIQLEIEHQDDFHLLVADPERIRQVVWNLLSNAVKFTDPGGWICCEISQVGSALVLCVSDSGRGIDPEFLPFVFDRFRQADASSTRKFGGLGLGLALVRHIVEIHGGTAKAESDGLGKGARFTVTLPIRATIPALVEDSARPQWESAHPEPQVTLKGVRVLVVDDEPDALDLVASVLRDVGAIAQTARSAAKAFQLFSLFQPQVVISDIGMPDEDGYSFIRRIRRLPAAEGGRIPALALSALARGEDRTLAMNAGYTAHVSKPVSPTVLVAEIGKLFSQARDSQDWAAETDEQPNPSAQ